MVLVLRHSQFARVGQYDARVVKSLRQVIDHHLIQRTAVSALLLHIQVVPRYLVIEHPLGNLKLGRLLTHRVQQRPHLRLSHRKHIVLKKECAYGYQHHQCYQRTHSLDERHARRLHRRQLKLLAQIAERHQRREQYSQRQRHRYHRQSRIEKQLRYHIHAQALPHEVIYITPQELHEHDEKAYKKRHDKQRYETPQHEHI